MNTPRKVPVGAMQPSQSLGESDGEVIDYKSDICQLYNAQVLGTKMGSFFIG